MQKTIVVLLLSFLTFLVQDNKLIHEQPEISKIKTFEQQFGSKLVPSSSKVSYSISHDLCPAAKEYDLAQPMRFARPGDELPPFLVEYYYAKSDSLVHCILYTVVTPDDPRFEKLGMPIYEKIFSDLVSQLNNELGKPDLLDKEFKQRENSEGTTSTRKEVVWTKKNMIVEGKFYQSNKRIRLIQRWTDN